MGVKGGLEAAATLQLAVKHALATPDLESLKALESQVGPLATLSADLSTLVARLLTSSL